jgi:hypothetical protein
MTTDPRQVSPRSGERMSVREYLLLDAAFPNSKYEYHEGAVRLISGGSAEHATIVGNIYMELRLQFRSGPCTVYNSDMRVQVGEGTHSLP